VGFGAKYGGVVRHCFQCGPTEEVTGVEGVLKAYEAVFKSGLTMSGPTVFTEVIQMAAARAQSGLEAAQRIGSQSYTILLILTDGAVTDKEATARRTSHDIVQQYTPNFLSVELSSNPNLPHFFLFV